MYSVPATLDMFVKQKNHQQYTINKHKYDFLK